MTYMLPDSELTPEAFNRRSEGALPGHIGLVVTHTGRDRFEGHFDIQRHHHAPNGFLHAGSLVTLADTLCGYATVANLREGATGFTTIELKTNFFATALEGRVNAVATPVHVGGTTQVWDCELTNAAGKRMALFRCSQLVLRAKG
ncbi:thioesterase family protein [Hyphomonas hirschiana VP5]|nr:MULTISPECIES: PaaI family thioesterase [Hyphomonas]KCZ93580.1 thioesterase family protein [Hyphomonas hirschiana VP5]